MRYRLTKLSITVIREGSPPPRTLNTPEEVAILAKDLVAQEDDDREHFWVVALDAQNRYIGHSEVSVGGATAAPVDAKIVFRHALLAGAVNLIAVHNHPSGDPTPSKDDKALTRRLVEGARLLDLGFHDHLIVGNGSGQWLSMAQHGML